MDGSVCARVRLHGDQKRASDAVSISFEAGFFSLINLAPAPVSLAKLEGSRLATAILLYETPSQTEPQGCTGDLQLECWDTNSSATLQPHRLVLSGAFLFFHIQIVSQQPSGINSILNRLLLNQSKPERDMT